MSIHVRSKRKRLYLDTYEQGQPRTWEALGLRLGDDPQLNKEAWRLADAIRLKREMQALARREGMLDPVGGKQTLVAYAKSITATELKKSTITISMAFLEQHFKDVKLLAIDAKAAERYRDFLVSESGLAQGTARIYFVAFKTVLNRAVRDKLITSNPAIGVRGVKAVDSNKVALTIDELTRMAARPLTGTPGADVSRAFMFSCHTGLRVSDLRTLTWKDIERQPTPRLSIVQTKTGRSVQVPLNASAWAIIDDKAIHKPGELVFNLTGAEGSSFFFFRRWEKIAGVEKHLSWHVARHTFAVLSLETGTDIYTVSKLLGHSSVNQTMTYARATDAMRQKAVDSLPETTMAKKA
ncbi:MAG: tyrosine-type recombinase/integrase [Clostridia bacterium]